MSSRKTEHGLSAALRKLAVGTLATLVALACANQTPTPAPTAASIPQTSSNPAAPAGPTRGQGSTPPAAASQFPPGDPDFYRAIWAGTADDVRSHIAAKAWKSTPATKMAIPFLYTAVRRAGPATVQILVDAGADVDARDSNRDPLLYTAIWRDKTEALKILVDAGADVDARDSGNDPTPVHCNLAGQDRGFEDSRGRRRGRGRQGFRRRSPLVHGRMAGQTGSSEHPCRHRRGRKFTEIQWRIVVVRSKVAEPCGNRADSPRCRRY